MPIKLPSDILPSEIAPRDVYLRRRELLVGAASLGLLAAAGLAARSAHAAPLNAAKSPLSTTDEPLTPLRT